MRVAGRFLEPARMLKGIQFDCLCGRYGSIATYSQGWRDVRSYPDSDQNAGFGNRDRMPVQFARDF